LQNAKYHCSEEHPAIRALHEKVERIKEERDNQTKQFANAYVEVMRLRWVAAKRRADELHTSFEVQRQAAQKLGVKAAKYAILQSELKRAERICEILDDRIKELNVAEDAGALNISILEVARAPTRPSRPQKARILSMSLALGLLFGGVLAFIRNWVDYELSSADEITAVLGIPVLGVVPKLGEQRAGLSGGYGILSLLGKNRAFGALRRILGGAGGVPGVNESPGTARTVRSAKRKRTRTARQSILAQARAYRAARTSVAYKTATGGQAVVCAEKMPASEFGQTPADRGQVVRLKPRSVAAEAYRTIRTAVFFGVPKDEAKTILVSSPSAGDGKSTLASNLAIAIAQAGQKALVIDADFRRAVQHTIFGLHNTIGLSSVCAGAARLDEAIVDGPVHGLGVLPTGPEVPNPAEVLNSNTFMEMLNNLCKCYDRVIIDSPPVLAVTDSQILAALCDITILVLRAEKSTRRVSQDAFDGLASVGGHVLGVVLNDVSRKRHRYGYYGGYRYYRGYGSYYGYSDRSAEEEAKEEAYA